MSFRLAARVWQTPDLPPATKLVLMALADQANSAGVCWPSRRTIARKCGLCVRTVASHLAILVECGLVEKTHRKRSDGSFSSSMYRVFPTAEGGRENSDPPDAGRSPLKVKNSHHDPIIDPSGSSGGGHPTPEEIEYIELRIKQAIATRRIQTTPDQMRASLVRRAQAGTLDIGTLPALQEWAAAPPEPKPTLKQKSPKIKGYSKMRQDATVGAVGIWLSRKKGTSNER